MADLQIQDITIWIAILSILNHYLLYRRNKFFGGIVFMGIGALAIGLSTTTTLTGSELTLYTGLGFLYFVIAFIVFIYDIGTILKK